MERRNKSTLSPADCYNRLANENYSFELMSDDDLDSIYYIAYERWAYHLTRQGYIDALYKKRSELQNRMNAIDERLQLRKEFAEVLRNGITFAGQVGEYVINQSVFEWLDKKISKRVTPKEKE